MVTFKNVVGTVTITATTSNGLTDNTGVISVYSEPTSVSVTKVTENVIGGTRQLTATVLPADARDKSVVWTSSNESIATVSSTGLVTFLNTVGSVTITATTTVGNFTDNTGEISVYSVPTSITLAPTNPTILVGSTQQLTATVLPANARNKNVTWVSSVPANATVSSTGLVTAVKSGTSVITCTSVESNTILATTTVTVTNPPVATITVNDVNSADDFNIDDIKNLTISFTPSNASTFQTTLVKSSGDGDVTINKVSETEYNVTATTAGSLIITASVVGNTSVNDTIELIVIDNTPPEEDEPEA